MEKPFLTLSAKEFNTGIAPGAHMGGGLFFKADGITPIIEPGTSQSTTNGLLMAGSSASVVSGTLTGNIIAAANDATVSKAYFSTDDAKLWGLTLGGTISSIRAVSNLVTGLEVFQGYLVYFQTTQVGRFDLASTYVDAWDTCTTDPIHATHVFYDKLYYGNGIGQVGIINSAFSNTKVALNIYSKHFVTDISDDGTYLAIAITNNTLADVANPVADTRILFWDGFSSSWNREYPVADPYIYSVQKTPFGTFAFGVTGIWQISFAGVKKVYSRSTGIYSNGATTPQYGRAVGSYFANALLWGGSTPTSNQAVKAFGQLDLSMHNGATFHPFLSTANKNITYVDGQMQKGFVFVGDSTPQLKMYPMGQSNVPQTGNTAQTVYFDPGTRMQIYRIDIVFGVPLATGDVLNVQVKTDEATAANAFGAADFSKDGAIRRKIITPPTKVVAEQFSLLFNFNAGAVKIKRVEVYGQPMTP